MSKNISAAGKQILITGGTSGVGLETARLLITGGAEVTIVGRDPIKGAAAEEALNHDPDRVGRATFVAADLSSMREVHTLADTVGQQVDRLDVLIHNAGIVTTRRTQTVDGYEQTFAVNYLAPFALTDRLLPLLRNSQQARVLSLTAAVEPIGRLPFKDLQRERHFGGLRAYAQSKRALAMFTLELARRQKAKVDGLTANVIDPFLVRTALTSAQDVPVLFKLARPLMIRPQTAAHWVSRAATDERLAGTTGRHFIFGHRTPTPPGTRSRKRASRLWDLSIELTRNPPPTTNR